MSCNTKQTKIPDYYSKIISLNSKEKKVYGYNKETQSWHCIECGIDMGPNNPRQLCDKTHCFNS